MVSGRKREYSTEVDMGRKRVQLLVLLTFVVAVSNGADPNTTVTSTTANTTTSRSATNPASTTTTNHTISDNSTTFAYLVRDPETGVICRTIATSISIKANYTSTDGDIKETFLTIPPTAKKRGTCRGVAPTMELIWSEDPTLEGTENRITLMIGSEHVMFSLHVIAYEIYIDGENFPDAEQEGKRFKCELLDFDEFSGSENNGIYRCEPNATASTVHVQITFNGYALGRPITWDSASTRTEENGVSGADMTQWSGYLLLAAKILMFLKLGHQGI